MHKGLCKSLLRKCSLVKKPMLAFYFYKLSFTAFSDLNAALKIKEFLPKEKCELHLDFILIAEIKAQKYSKFALLCLCT